MWQTHPEVAEGNAWTTSGVYEDSDQLLRRTTPFPEELPDLGSIPFGCDTEQIQERLAPELLAARLLSPARKEAVFVAGVLVTGDRHRGAEVIPLASACGPCRCGLQLGFSASETGVAYLPLSLTIVAASAVASRLVDRFTPKHVLVAGLLITIGGFVVLATLSGHGDYESHVVPAMIMLGVGPGTSFVPITIAGASERGRSIGENVRVGGEAKRGIEDDP